MIRAIFVTHCTFLYILVVGLPFLIHAWLTKNTDRLYQVGMTGARLALWLSGVRLEVHGLEKIPHGRAAIYMPNHQSNCDPPAVISILPPVLVMAKQEFFRVPVLGTAMVLSRFHSCRSQKPRAGHCRSGARRGLDESRATLFWRFRKARAARDGRLQTFKKGLFVMAIKAGALIVPISVSGARKIMPKGQFAIHPGRVRITIQDPISAENYTLEERRELITVTRQAILKGLDPEEWPREEAERRRE